MNKELLRRVAVQADVSEFEVSQYDEKGEHPLVHFLSSTVIPRSSRFPRTTAYYYLDWFPHEMSYVWMLSDEDLEEFRSLDRDEYLRLMRSVIHRLANRGDVVILGRGGQVMLEDRKDALHVRTVAPLENRIRRVMERMEIEYDSVAKLTKKTDRDRSRYIKNYYCADWDDPELYHLILDTGKMDMAVHLRSTGCGGFVGKDGSKGHLTRVKRGNVCSAII